MSTSATTDIGPLTWVKSEIDLALNRALEALARQDGEGAPALPAARTHLHQARGALSIVGLDGVTRLAEAAEQLLDAAEAGHPGPEDCADAARQAIDAIRRYLDELLAGQPDQALRLLPDYRAVMARLGHAEAPAADLFYPDLTPRPPRREQEPPALAPDQAAARIKAARMAFQRGMLKWLKQDPQGLDDMRGALAAVEATQESPSARAFWWVGLAFLDALAAGRVAVTAETRHLCARIDTQIRKLLEGSRTVAERLMRDTLYHVAVAGDAGDHAARVRATYRLDQLLPAAATTPDLAPARALLEPCREQVAQCIDAWNRFSSGAAAALPEFHDRVRALAERTGKLGQADLAGLAGRMVETADALRKAPLAHSDALALEMATALLLMDNALAGFQYLGAEFAGQAGVVGQRLTAAVRGEPLADIDIPLLDEMSRQAREKLLLGQVAREIQANLAIIEQTLDAYFRDPGKAGELAGLARPVKQVEGALTVLGESRAVEVLRECAAAIDGFAGGGESQPRRSADFEEVAGKLSALGFFVDQLRHGPADIDAFLRPPAPPDAAEPTAETELREARRQARNLVDALREQPGDQALRGEIRQSLEVVRDHAELVDDAALVGQARAAIEAIEHETAPEAIEAIEEAVGQLAPAAAMAPSPEAKRLAEASTEQIDAELLGIFIEEAHEVLAGIVGQLPRLESHRHDHEALVTVRRGFHTLKGSGRMVGLADFGDAAWAVEQVLNRWLQREQEATPALLDMVRQAHALFTDWVARLEAGDGVRHDTSALIDACGRLVGEAAVPAMPAAPPLEPEAPPEPSPPAEPELPASPPEPEVPAPPPEPEAPPPEPETRAAPVLRLVQPPPPEPEDVRIGELSLSPTLFDLYLAEARQHLATLQHELGFEAAPPRTMIRAAHTLAGISATTGVIPINRVAHALEMALNRLDEAGAAPDDAQHLLMARAIGALEGMIGAVAERRMPQLEEALADQLDALVAPPRAAEAPEVPEAQQAPEAPEAPPEEAAGEIPPAPEPTVPPPEPPEAERRQLRLADELDPQLLPIFLEESADLVHGIAAGLREWRGQPDNLGPADDLKRLLHTLKGSARMAGAMSIGQLVHGMETRIEDAVAVGTVTPAFIDTLDASFDRVELMLEQLRTGAPASAESLPPSPLLPPIVAPAPPMAAAPAPIAPAVRVPPTPRAGESEGVAHAMLRVRADTVDKLVNEAGEIAIARGRIEGEMRALKGSLLDLTENVIRLRNQLREIEIQAESQMLSRQALAAEQERQFDPLEFDRFTRFQELTRMMAESVNDVATSQQALLQNLDHAEAALTAQARLNREHSQALMNVRMVPFNMLADRLYRVVRQTAKEMGKRANLDIRGGQTEIDRSVLEKMTGPLEHLLRNAIAHGLETPAGRRAAGKPEIGQITLRVAQEGNEIVIQLADDGAGLDIERIRARALAAGLIGADEQPGEEQLAQLIFRPGLSTADQLSAVAGRGIGMDVVRSEAANLGGRVRVDFEAGKGTRFQVHLPLTLAVIQAVLVRVGNRRYAIPSSMVAQASELKPDAIAAIRAEGGTVWLGERYPWHYLPTLLGDSLARPEPARRHWLLLVRAGDRPLALEVDDLAGNQELVVKNIGPQLARVAGVAGATVLGDGEIVLILNPVALAVRPRLTLPAAAEAAATGAEPAPAPTTTAAAGTVMVVDDSLTVRKITGRLLARAGYHVLTAKDGVDALEQLLDIAPDVMLVDIEMPRMDGFDLTRNIRADERLKRVPIIMITSRIGDKHRNYAREIGVDHYLGKPYDEDELLKLIAGCIARQP